MKFKNPDLQWIVDFNYNFDVVVHYSYQIGVNFDNFGSVIHMAND